MKAILEFDLPEESYEYRLHTHAVDLSTALDDVRGMLRGYWEHADLEDVTANQLIDKIWDRFHDIAGPVMEAVQ